MSQELPVDGAGEYIRNLVIYVLLRPWDRVRASLKSNRNPLGQLNQEAADQNKNYCEL